MYSLYKGVYTNELEPSEFSMGQNYPNPFKKKTVIKYCVAYKTRVQIVVYNSEGKLIEKLIDQEKKPGTYELEFNSLTDHSGKSRKLLDGYYFYQMVAGDYSSEKKWLCINNLLRSNKMKIFLQTLFFFLLVTKICLAQWVQVGLNNEGIKDIAIKDATIFAITSDSGKVYRSLDNGINWTMIVDSCAVDVAISQTGKIFMTQDSTLNIPPPFDRTFLLSSMDNGEAWTRVNMIEQIKDSLPYWWLCRPINIMVSPAGVIFCYIRDRGRDEFDCFAKSTDDGVSWITIGESVTGGKLFDFRNQFVITVGEISGVGAYGNVVHLSSDFGNTWSNIGQVETGDFYAIGFFSNQNIIVGGTFIWGPNYPKALYISTDMCSTWTLIDTLITSQVGLSYSIGSKEGMIIGTKELGVFLFSDEGDSLGSWNEGLTNLNIQALTLDNNGYVYAGTQNGVWRRPLSEIVTSVEENQIPAPSSYILAQNFPNPFNPSTKIKYSVSQLSQVQIKVYDVLGNEIETLVNEEKPVGTYEITWNAVNLTSGVYFYQLKAGSFIDTKKMILMK